jgi:preprotein translocase subunit SecA
VESTRVRSRIAWRDRLRRLQGYPVESDLRRYDAALNEIADLEGEVAKLADASLEERARDLRARAAAGESRTRLRTHAFALVRDAARRTLGQRPYDVQVVAALALDQRAIVEMQTGEGKTLTAVMPAVLNALAGRGVHVLTFNGYLAARDAEWMLPIYRMLGLSVACVQQGMSLDARRAAYAAEITYVTATEAGFDHLRDLLAADPRQLVHRPFHFALVDEADSLMVDEARVPLVIAGDVDHDGSSLAMVNELVASLSPGVHFDTDDYARDVELTEAGIEHVERVLGCGALHSDANYALLTQLNCALHARVLLRRDVDYIVRNGRIDIVDELTGRVVADRHWPDGLQAALEAKEGLERRRNGRILGSITLQSFLRGYPHLCGMTGTARDCAAELSQVYGVDVVVIPTHRPMIRLDRPDAIFTHRAAKEQALVDEVQRVHASGQPVLVGTLTVEESERVAALLTASGVKCRVLNARNDAAEAHIVAAAGRFGAVTIATNMAGRGTDIRLGGANERDRERVAALGGLYVIGTNRHESRRIDLQLRGRAGRQGDSGESRSFLSLEDDILVRYGIRCLIPAPVMPAASEQAVDTPVLRREVARAQRIVDGQNLEIRRTLASYAEVVENQHARLMERRQALLRGEVVPDVWTQSPQRRAALVSAAGEAAVREAERTITLYQIDRAWRDHLALCADLREGIHLVRLGGQDPLTHFTREAIAAFSKVEESIDDAVLKSIEQVCVENGHLDLAELRITGPSSTWTYLVNDDPFRNQIGSLLTGIGGATIAVYSASILMPLLILWGMVQTFFRRRSRHSREGQEW